MKTTFITLFAVLLACVAPCCLAKPNGGWGAGAINIAGGLGHGGWSGGGAGWAGAPLVGADGWAGSGCGPAPPQVISAAWGARLPGPSIQLLPAHSQLIKLVAGGHACGCC